VGYRIASGGTTLAYLPDHEPALGVRNFPRAPAWTSGYELAAGVDLLIHDAQFSDADYPHYVGWGHSSLSHVLKFAALAGVKQLVPFHHNPAYDDQALDRLMELAESAARPAVRVARGMEGASFVLDGSG
jgi:phosphoribosyl 1,2-cyclic phosphodiesterase